VFVDIDPVTYNIDPAQIEAKITPHTKAIIPVHLYGQSAEMDEIMAIAKKHNLLVIEDAAQAIGAEYKGRRLGSIGDYGCFSFFPSKNLGCAGDGGIVTTNDPQRDERLKIFRNHGSKPKYYHKFIGGNFRLDTIQAAVVLAKLPHLDGWSQARQRNANRYRGLFQHKKALGKGVLSLPEEIASRHIYNQFIIRVERRDDLLKFLKERSIGIEVYYPVPFHLQECFKYLGYKPGEFPESEKAANQTIALPIYPELTEEQTEYVVDRIVEFYTK
jgi:dTDP-4-amino-4,6-dideoxygalactose transaminase